MEEWAVVILFRIQTVRLAGTYKMGPCRLNNTSPEPFLCVVNMTDDAQSLASNVGHLCMLRKLFCVTFGNRRSNMRGAAQVASLH